jgi:hypothetical protein
MDTLVHLEKMVIQVQTAKYQVLLGLRDQQAYRVMMVHLEKMD